MTTLKIVLTSIFMAIFLAFAAVMILVVCGVIQTSQSSVFALLGVLVAQCVTVITTMIKAPHYFEDPEAIKTLKVKHADEILAIKQQQTAGVSPRIQVF